MGNAGSNNVPRDRHKSNSSDIIAGSPKEGHGQAFVFDKKPGILYQGRSQEEEDPIFSKPLPQDTEFLPEPRQRANTLSEVTTNEDKDDPSLHQALPTVFKWEGGGKQVYISGTFSEWKTLPMVKSHGDFVTIIDLPEGDHAYKFLVDGEWKHDPRLVNI